ncbi:MAG TPA: hypothetical protein VGG82_10380 [Casimicrobiaceae bacterium]
MRHPFRYLLAPALALWAASAVAEFHTYKIEQIFSNADGTVQFVVMHESEGMNAENFWMGNTFTSTHLGTTQTFVFRNNLPGAMCGYYGCSGGGTANTRVLIASQGFAALHLVTPDFIMPNGFIATDGATLNYAGVDFVAVNSLPTDGVHALDRNGAVIPNMATNFAGQSGSVGLAAATNYQGLWYAAPAESESGWGINFAHQGDAIFASWFTYDLTGKGWWLVMSANKTAPNVYGGTLLQGTGPAFDAVPFPPLGSPGGATGTSVGNGSLTFTDANNGMFAYTVNGISQTKAITRQQFGPMPTCTFGTQMNLALATNYTDLWWAAPAGSEAGWGINLTHQGDSIFATWFTFDHDHTPMWLVVSAPKTMPGTYAGTLIRTSGPPFNAVPFPPVGAPGGATGPNVGTATFTFTDGNNASFAYTVNGVSQTKAITREVFQAPGTTCQ